MNLVFLLDSHTISPAMAGITVGALAGAIGFLLVYLFVARGEHPRRSPDVLLVPRYATAPAAAARVAPRATAALSAGSLAEMGIPVGPFGERLAPPPPPRAAEPDPAAESSGSLQAAVTVSPVVMLGIIPSDSAAMRAVSVAELSYEDDAPTEIAETFFDEPPRPRERGARPKIRAVAPAGPRFPQA